MTREEGHAAAPHARNADVVSLGILVADVVVRKVDRLPERGTLALVDELALRGGGGALSASTWLAGWGLRVSAVGKLGLDPFGDFLHALLVERGIRPDGVIRVDDVPTSASVALVDSTGDRTFLHLPGANGALHAEELDENVLFGGRALLYTGALVMPGLDGEPAAAILAECRRRGIVTALDTVFDPSGNWSRILPALEHVDLFMPALAEARGITGCDDPRAASLWLRQRGVREVAVKLGEHGCFGMGPDFDGPVGAVPVDALDGTGAGDAFVAGARYGKLAGWPFERSLRLANAAGAYATTSIGAVDRAVPIAELAGLDQQGAFA